MTTINNKVINVIPPVAAVDEKPFAIHVIAFTQIFLQQQQWLVAVAGQMTQRPQRPQFHRF